MSNRTHGAVRHLNVFAAVIVLFAFALTPLAGAPTRASAEPLDNAVLEWNLHAVNAFLNPPAAPTPGAGLAPQVAILHLAMVQGAIYDAVNMIEGGYQPYSDSLPDADPDASQSAAIATAARGVIVGVEVVPALSPAIIDRVNQLLGGCDRCCNGC